MQTHSQRWLQHLCPARLLHSNSSRTRSPSRSQQRSRRLVSLLQPLLILLQTRGLPGEQRQLATHQQQQHQASPSQAAYHSSSSSSNRRCSSSNPLVAYQQAQAQLVVQAACPQAAAAAAAQDPRAAAQRLVASSQRLLLARLAATCHQQLHRGPMVVPQ